MAFLPLQLINCEKMEAEQLKNLKDNYGKFLSLYRNLKNASNKKERKEVEYDLNYHKERMIKDLELMKYDLHISHYQYDNDYFKNDVDSIIYKIESQNKEISIKIKEITQKGNLTEFEDSLEKIIRSILNSQCNISCNDLDDISFLEQSKLYAFNPIIRIGFKGQKEKPIHYIWDILHEFGHFLSGVPKPGEEKTIARETLAWDLALEELKKLPQLLEHVDDFEIYKEQCLLTYK